MDTKYVIIFDICFNCFNIVKLTKEELEASKKYAKFENFLLTLQDKYEFSLKNCQWLATDEFGIYRYESGNLASKESFV